MKSTKCPEFSSLPLIYAQPGCLSRLILAGPGPSDSSSGEQTAPQTALPFSSRATVQKAASGPPVPRLRVMGFTWLFPVPEKWAGLGSPPSLFLTGFQELACQWGWGWGWGTCLCPTPQPLRVVDVCICDLTLLGLGMPGRGARS